MRLTIVRIRERPRVEIPVVRVVVKIRFDSCFERPVEPFYLAIGLRMVGRSELVLDVEYLTYRLKELRRETLSVVR